MKSITPRDAAIMLSITLTTLIHGPWATASEPEVLELRLTAADALSPPLQTTLVPPFKDQIDGNAAVYYGKVFAEQQALMSSVEFWGAAREMSQTALGELRTDPQIELPTQSDLIYGYLRSAALAEQCDWQLRLRDQPFYMTLLPELQELRKAHQWLLLRMRYQIAAGQVSDAIETFQTGLRLCQNAAQSDLTVGAAIGNAAGIHQMNHALKLIEQPDCPNLYWSLTNLPSPLIDIRLAAIAERDGLALTFPLLEQLDTRDRSVEDWNRLAAEFWKSVDEMASTPMTEPTDTTLLTLRLYPAAKKALKSFGVQGVESMPVAQVVLRYCFQAYLDQYDRQSCWLAFDYPQAIENIRGERRSKGVSPLIEAFMPNFEAMLIAQTRLASRVAVLRTIEAIRMHVAQHDGQVPRRLAEITAVPVPNDPFTGEPFDYQVDGRTAQLVVDEHDGLTRIFRLQFTPEQAP